jgi:hypothetical protein
MLSLANVESPKCYVPTEVDEQLNLAITNRRFILKLIKYR